MIKRQFYREEHGDKDNASSDSSSSDSELEAGASEESEDEVAAEAKEDGNESCSTSSGYEREDGSGNEIDVESSGFTNEDEEIGNNRQSPVGRKPHSKHGTELLKKDFKGMDGKESVQSDMPACILKCKSVYKCRICPRIVCLNEETMRVHLNSKRHARSEKLLKGNRLKAMLNSDGEIENQETPAEMNARIIALAQDKSKKKDKGRQRQRKRSRNKIVGEDSNMVKASGSTKSHAKKRHKNEN